MQAVTLNKTGQYAIFALSSPYSNILNIRTFTEDLSGVGTLIKQFRWSTDGNVWSYWIELTQQNLNSLTLNADLPFYIEYKYQLATQGSMTILNVQIEPNYKPQDYNSQIVLPTLSCTECSVDRASILNVCTPTFNPYAVNPAINLYKDLAESIQDMFGMEALYMRAIPNSRSGDVVFREWTLYNVNEPICTKIMVNNNEFPSNDAQYDSYGIGYEQPFEVEIVKSNFERDFGLDAAPQKGDVVYFSILGNRIYEIQSSSPVRGFMMEIVSWKCELTIYKPKSNRSMPDSIKDIMEDIARTTNSEFGEELIKETGDITNPLQFDRKLGTTDQDPIRTYVNASLLIPSTSLTNHALTVADHYYDLNSVLAPISDELCVEYKTLSNFSETQDFSFTSWFKHVTPRFTIPEDPCRLFNKIGNTIDVSISSTRTYSLGTLVHIQRQGRLSFYGVIVAIMNPKTFKIAINSDVVTYLNNLSPSWLSAPGYSMKRTFKHTYINGYGEIASPTKKAGWKLESYISRYFVYTEGETTTVIPLNESLVENQWYGAVFNYSAKFKQMNFSIWQVNTDRRATNELASVFTRTLNNITIDDKNFGGTFGLYSSPHHQTNVRLFKEIIPYEQQSTLLNQYIVSDASQALIIDNALPTINLPFVGNTK